MKQPIERAPQAKVTDAEIEQALIQANGQPTKAAEILDVNYITIWRRCNENPRLEEVKQAYRGRAFQNIDSLSVASVLMGVMRQPETDEEGTVLRDEDGAIIYREVAISPSQRLHHGNLLMNLYKGSEGIKDQLEISSDSIDLEDASLETLKELEELYSKKKKGD